MSDLCRLIWCALIGLFRPRAALEAENLVLRHQLNVLRRKSPKRVALSSARLEDLPAQSCRRHRIDGPVPGPDDFVSAVVRIADPATQSTQACVAGCNRASERRMACPAAD